MKIIKSALLVVAAIGLSACSSLPSCSSSDAETLIKQIIDERAVLLGKFVELKDIEETAYNKESDIRMCKGQLTTTHGTEAVEYSIRWADKSKEKFYLELR